MHTSGHQYILFYFLFQFVVNKTEKVWNLQKALSLCTNKMCRFEIIDCIKYVYCIKHAYKFLLREQVGFAAVLWRLRQCVSCFPLKWKPFIRHRLHMTFIKERLLEQNSHLCSLKKRNNKNFLKEGCFLVVHAALSQILVVQDFGDPTAALWRLVPYPGGGRWYKIKTTIPWSRWYDRSGSCTRSVSPPCSCSWLAAGGSVATRVWRVWYMMAALVRFSSPTLYACSQSENCVKSTILMLRYSICLSRIWILSMHRF